MEGKRFINYALGIAFIIASVGLVFISIWLLIKADPWLMQSTPRVPYYSSYCESAKDGYFLSVTVDNYSGKKELENVQCEITTLGDLTVESTQQELGNIPAGSSNSCYFLLKGNQEGMVSTRIKFDEGVFYTNTICRNYSEEIIYGEDSDCGCGY